MAWAPSNFKENKSREKCSKRPPLCGWGHRDSGKQDTCRGHDAYRGPPRLSCFPHQRVRGPREPPPGHRSPRSKPASMPNVVPKPARLIGEPRLPGCHYLRRWSQCEVTYGKRSSLMSDRSWERPPP